MKLAGEHANFSRLSAMQYMGVLFFRHTAGKLVMLVNFLMV